MSAANPPFDHAAVAREFDIITKALERLKALLAEAAPETEEFDPKDPANKYEIPYEAGGSMKKLTQRGVEITYRYFDRGRSCYAVAILMGISYGAAAHRYNAWKKLGGAQRVKQPL